MDTTTPNIVWPTMALEVLCPYWHGGVQTDATKDLQCIVERIQPIRLWRPCVMHMFGPNSVGKTVQTDPTLLCYASGTKEQKKCWLKSLIGFKRCTTAINSQQHATTCNNMQQGVQADATCKTM